MKVKEKIIEFVLLCAACISIFTTLGIIYILITESISFFKEVSIWDFLFDDQWTPLFADQHFGIRVLLAGTITSSFLAISIAIPFGTIISIYLSEFSNHSLREILKPILELPVS